VLTRWMGDQKFCILSLERSLGPLTTAGHETHCWALTQEPYNHNGDFACVDGFPVLAGVLDVVVPRISATNNNMPHNHASVML
jgi:hypothetical protein